MRKFKNIYIYIFWQTTMNISEKSNLKHFRQNFRMWKQVGNQNFVISPAFFLFKMSDLKNRGTKKMNFQGNTIRKYPLKAPPNDGVRKTIRKSL